MPAAAYDYSAALGIQHFIQVLRMAAVDPDLADAAYANSGANLSSWLNVTGALSGPQVVTAAGSGTSFRLQVGGGTRTITNAALATNVATLTLSAAAGVLVGEQIAVADLPAPFASLNGLQTVTAVTTASPFTVSFALTGSNITSAAVAGGTVTTGIYPLDGTGKAIQLLNVTGAPLQTTTADESVITHDQTTRGGSISFATSDSHSAAFKGMTVHRSVDHKVLEILREFGVSEELAVKYLRIGPNGTTERKFCYARISSKQEEGDAGALVKYGATMSVLGRVYTLFDNN